MATAIDYAGAWQRLNEALARNVQQAESDAEMFAFLLTSTLAAFNAQGLLDDKAATRAIEMLHELHQVEV
ncbi:hypothetical protein EFK68_04855 [Pseudomonas aeruginosa]|nr:hypothetical protein EFK68_04855 [Pseudomonas aeruginosa]